MRIVAGKWKGKPIDVPPGLPIRPTTDRAKEALFNILDNRIDWPSTSALDLFAGSGSISYELVSRGCPRLVAVDSHRACCRFIQTKAAELGMTTVEVIQADVFSYIKKAKNPFDFIFADPPYNLPNLGNLVDELLSLGILARQGLLVCEHPSLIALNHRHGFLETRRYGSASFSFFS